MITSSTPKVLNVSIDLGMHGRDATPQPPIEVCLRVIEEPLLRLVSVDLGAMADISSLGEVFDFAKDYLGLLKVKLVFLLVSISHRSLDRV